MKFTSKQQTARLCSDIRFGLPVLVQGKNGNALVYSIESIRPAVMDEIEVSKIEAAFTPYVALTRKRAQTLKARAYNDGAANIELPKKFSFQWLKAIADPVFDLDYPLKGPYHGIRKSQFNDISEAALKLCKNSQLLPACLILPLNYKTYLAYQKKGLLAQNAKKINYNDPTSSLDIVSSARVPIAPDINAKVYVFRNSESTVEHYAIQIGHPKKSNPVLTRLHSACFTGDILHSLKCDCGEQLQKTIALMKEERSGIILYLNQEGRGIGLANKMKAYNLQDQGYDTIEANEILGFDDDERDLSIGSKILKSLNIKEIRLLTNNPKKIASMKQAGIEIIEIIPILTQSTSENKSYLETKARKSGHILS